MMRLVGRRLKMAHREHREAEKPKKSVFYKTNPDAEELTR
jgi:hypothetical protein